jgi:segregation and condensation protein A
MENKCQIKLQIFEGPLDLLLHLINKNKLDITDIPIEAITNQYLEYLSLMQQMDIAVAGEYLLMAATLMHIKSSMLLPQPKGAICEEDDPRMEIIRPLKELIEFRNAAKHLFDRPVLGEKVFTGGYNLETFLREITKDKPKNDEILSYSPKSVEVSIETLFNAYLSILEKNRVYPILQINSRETLSERMSYIMDLLYQKGSLKFLEIHSDISRYSIIISFLAILELSKAEKIRIIQEIEKNKDIPEIQIFLLNENSTFIKYPEKASFYQTNAKRNWKNIN